MDEAEKIYKAIFRSNIPLRLKERFLRASEIFSQGYPEKETHEYRSALAKITDLEALEIFARMKDKLPLLVLKFKLAVSLAETLPEYQRYYVNEKDRRVASLLSLWWGGLRTAVKFIKGWFLFRIINNV